MEEKIYIVEYIILILNSHYQILSVKHTKKKLQLTVYLQNNKKKKYIKTIESRIWSKSATPKMKKENCQ